MFILRFDHKPFEDTSKGRPSVSCLYGVSVNHESTALREAHYAKYDMTNVMNYQDNGVGLESVIFRMSAPRWDNETNEI